MAKRHPPIRITCRILLRPLLGINYLILGLVYSTLSQKPWQRFCDHPTAISRPPCCLSAGIYNTELTASLFFFHERDSPTWPCIALPCSQKPPQATPSTPLPISIQAPTKRGSNTHDLLVLTCHVPRFAAPPVGRPSSHPWFSTFNINSTTMGAISISPCCPPPEI